MAVIVADKKPALPGIALLEIRSTGCLFSNGWVD